MDPTDLVTGGGAASVIAILTWMYREMRADRDYWRELFMRSLEAGEEAVALKKRRR